MTWKRYVRLTRRDVARMLVLIGIRQRHDTPEQTEAYALMMDQRHFNPGPQQRRKAQ